jgi:integrase/recombinase XerD
VLTLYRRHTAKCKYQTRRHRHCQCPIWAEGSIHGQNLRQSINLRNWEAAHRLINEWEISKPSQTVFVRDAADRFLQDAEARQLGWETVKKYKQTVAAIKKEFGDRFLRSLTVDDLRAFREKWTVAGSTTVKRLEFVKAFFRFCVDSEWISKSPAKSLKPPVVKAKPTMPFTSEEWEKILWALDAYGELHPNSPVIVGKKLKALVLLMRYGGIRISDAVGLKRDRIKNGKLFLYTHKTKVAVWVPLPKNVLNALKECDEGDEHYFYNPGTKLKTWTNEWEERMKKIFVIAGVPSGHSHQLRDTFAVSILEAGVPLETVAVLLGNTLKVAEKHYAPWVKSRQVSLEAAVERAWKLN